MRLLRFKRELQVYCIGQLPVKLASLGSTVQVPVPQVVKVGNHPNQLKYQNMFVYACTLQVNHQQRLQVNHQQRRGLWETIHHVLIIEHVELLYCTSHKTFISLEVISHSKYKLKKNYHKVEQSHLFLQTNTTISVHI